MISIQIPVLDYKLAADWYELGDDILLFLPGYTSSKKSYADLVGRMVEKTGMSALVIDYGGHGESPFDLRDVSPAQNFLEVITVFDWLHEKYPGRNIYVIGTSYGGFLGTQLTKYREFRKLVLRVPAIWPPEEFYNKWGIRLDDEAAHDKRQMAFRRDAERLAQHPLLARASRFKGKTMVIVHGEDELVPKETTDAFIKAFKADVYVAEGFKHNFMTAPTEESKEAYRRAIVDWLNNE